MYFVFYQLYVTSPTYLPLCLFSGDVTSANTAVKQRSEFTSDEDYANFMTSMVTPGLKVRCCQDGGQGKFKVGDEGMIVEVNRDFWFEFPVRVQWRNGNTVWVNYINIELVDTPIN